MVSPGSLVFLTMQARRFALFRDRFRGGSADHFGYLDKKLLGVAVHCGDSSLPSHGTQGPTRAMDMEE